MHFSNDTVYLKLFCIHLLEIYLLFFGSYVGLYTEIYLFHFFAFFYFFTPNTILKISDFHYFQYFRKKFQTNSKQIEPN
jgi:hypothetical protein